MGNGLNRRLLAELLCLADSKWTLGHWYIKVMLNCRALTDATAFAGMSQDELGHARALFKHLEDSQSLPEHQLEFGRSAQQVHSMQLLDAPPQSRGDFMLTAYLAEAALWNFLATFRDGAEAVLAGMVRHFGKESRFHRLNLLGWVKSLGDQERRQMVEALPVRLPLAMQWFGAKAESRSDPLLAQGIRSAPLHEARQALAEGPVQELSANLGADIPAKLIEAAPGADWDSRRRRPRGSAMPATLWAFMLPDNDAAKLARRPLSVSIADNIDLFDKPA